jgi:guanine deaminase
MFSEVKMTQDEFMRAAVEEAESGMRKNMGGPFGAVVVRDGMIVARGHNEVVGTHDPTAHAEIVAIRRAAMALGRFDLSDCEIYSSCEPCPMCFAAVYWARLKKLYFACTRADAEKIGFDDRIIYDIIAGRAENSQFRAVRLITGNYMRPFEEWFSKSDRTGY